MQNRYCAPTREVTQRALEVWAAMAIAWEAALREDALRSARPGLERELVLLECYRGYR